jgi:hypothetical protein
MQHPRTGIQHKAALLLQTAKVSRKDRGTDRCHVGVPPVCRRANYPPRLDSGVRAIGDTALVWFGADGVAPPRPPFIRNESRKSAHTKPLFIVHEKAKKIKSDAVFSRKRRIFLFLLSKCTAQRKKVRLPRTGSLT